MTEKEQSDNIKKSLTFLGRLYGEARVNIVAIDPHSENVTGITRSIDDPEIETFLNKNYDKRNLYYSVNGPHSGAPDGKLKKEHIGTIYAVWIDADPKPCPEDVDPKEHFEAERKRLLQFAKELMEGDNPPTFVTDSGGGIQAFWFLEHPVAVTPETKAHYEGISRALAQKYGTDSVHNIDRIMRLPYTWNIPTKKKKGRKKALAKCTRIGNFYKQIDWVEPVMVAESENDKIDYAALDWKKVTAPLDAELQNRLAAARVTNQKIDDLWTNKINMKPSRSERDFALAKELKSEGFDLSETGAIMFSFPHGKGKELTRREIVRCYERSGVDFENSVDAETIAAIEAQVNPILKARAAGTPLEEDLSKTARFRSIKLKDMKWRSSGRPIYRDFIYESAITIVYGKSNTGKSFFASDLAGHIALGLPWNEMEFEPETAPAVLYICAEAGESFGVRGQALMRRLGVKDLPFFVITDAPEFTKEDKSDAKAIVQEIQRIERENGVKIGIVVVDTLAVTFTGDENSSDKMGDYVKNMKYIQRHAKTGVIVVHHSGKDQAAGARGSSALQAASDTELEVRSEKRGERYARQVEVKKQRTGKAGMVIAFGLQVADLGLDDRGKKLDSCYVTTETDTDFADVSASPFSGLEHNLKMALKAIYVFDKTKLPDNVYVIDKGIEKIKTKSGKLFTPKEIKSILFKDLREQSPTQWMILTKEKDKNDENKELFSYMLEQLDHFAKPVPRGILQDLERAGTKMEKDGYKVINKDFELLEGVLEQLEQCWNNEKSSNG